MSEMAIGTDLNRQRPPLPDRLAAGFLLVLLALGSFALWIVIPAGWLWVASKVTDSGTSHFAVSILGMPVAIILFGVVLAWINRLYMRVRWSHVPPPEAEDEEEERRILRGPLEPLLVGSLAVAIAAFVFWFFVLAEEPPPLLAPS